MMVVSCSGNLTASILDSLPILRLGNTIDHCVCTWYSALSTSFSMLTMTS